MKELKLTDKEKELIKVKLQYIKYRQEATLTILNKAIWVGGIIFVGLLGIMLNYLINQELVFETFIIYSSFLVGIFLISFVVFLKILSIYIGKYKMEVDYRHNRLINQIKENKII